MEPLKLTDYQQALYDKHIEHKWVLKIGHKTTVVAIRLHNGFEIVGTSTCVDVEDYDFAIGEHYAIVDALNQLDTYIGFMRQEEMKKQVTLKIQVESFLNEIDAKKGKELAKNIMNGLKVRGK